MSLSKQRILYIFFILIAGFLCCRIAVLTPYNSHPDEYTHVDAFKYFETNWWPPDLGSDQLIYSPFGQSHVYTGELVYLVYGKIGHIVNQLFQTTKHRYLVYRFLNILLFIITLSILFYAPCKSIKTVPIAFVFLCIPQISYIYSYANYDGWAVSSTVFLFVWAIVMSERADVPWSWSATVLLGILTGLIFSSRQPDLLGIVIPYFILGVKAFRSSKGHNVLPKYVPRIVIVLLISFCIASPLKWVFRQSQGDFHAAYEKMREDKARKPFKPSIRTYPTYHLAEKGETYRHLLIDRKWLILSYMSFFGGYGYMAFWNPNWIYWTAGISLFLVFSITSYTYIRQRRAIGFLYRWVMVLSLLLFVTNLGASIYHSMHVDFQAQGRYLFCTFIPFTIMLTGLVGFESRKVQKVRGGLLIILYFLSISSLFFIAPLSRRLI